jgi:hypothetical protein
MKSVIFNKKSSRKGIKLHSCHSFIHKVNMTMLTYTLVIINQCLQALDCKCEAVEDCTAKIRYHIMSEK